MYHPEYLEHVPPRMRLILGGLFCFTLWIFSLVVYRLFFHPLARIPGPLLQRISGVPRIWQCYIGNRYLCEVEAHEKYGSVVRTGPNSVRRIVEKWTKFTRSKSADWHKVIFNTLSSLQALHVKSANVFKGDEFYGLLDGGPAGGKSVQMIADNEAHSARRRLLDKALPPRDQVFQDINDLSQNLVDVIEEEAGVHDGVVDIARVTSWYSFDVISMIAFGQAFDMLHTNTWRWLPLCLQQMSAFLYAAGFASGHIPFLRFFQWFLRTSWPSRLGLTTAVQAQKYADLAAERVQDRGNRLKSEKGLAESGRKDIFGHLMEAKFHNSADLSSESSLLIAAGSDAVRFAVAATMFYLLQNADAKEKVTAEVRALEVGQERLNESKVSSLKYLRACIDEAMRLSPPKAGSIPRETGEGGIVIDGVFLPEGMSVGTSTYALHRDPEIYKQPYEYRPERWLERPHDPRLYAAFTPFMKGPRACPGKAVAYVAMQTALFHILREYDVENATEGNKSVAGLEVGNGSWRHGNDYPFNDWIIGYTKGPFVRITRWNGTAR